MARADWLQARCLGTPAFGSNASPWLRPNAPGTSREISGTVPRRVASLHFLAPLAGSSGGALAAVFCGLQLNADAALEATFNICNAINMSPRKSSRGILGSLLAKELDSFLPQDAHIRLNQWQGSVRIGLVSPSSASLGLCETCMLGVIRQFSLPVF